MDALSALHSRVSVSRLTGPEPDQQQLENIYRAALRAADHAMLRPWRFLVITGESRGRLGDLFVQASLMQNPVLKPAKQDSIRNKALRAPVIIVAISSPHPHPKVPEIEQHLSTGAAVQNMLTAAFAQGLGAIWRTGPMAFHPAVHEGLGLTPQESIIGFLYLGHSDGPVRPTPELSTDDYFKPW